MKLWLISLPIIAVVAWFTWLCFRVDAVEQRIRERMRHD